MTKSLVWGVAKSKRKLLRGKECSWKVNNKSKRTNSAELDTLEQPLDRIRKVIIIFSINKGVFQLIVIPEKILDSILVSLV